MSNYAATVVEINNIRPHSNADRLNCTNIFGNNVIIGKDVQIGDKGLFFPVESQLGEQFCLANDLIRRKDANGKPTGGMFDGNRRVRAIKLRGEYSMGFFCQLNYLDNLEEGLSNGLKVGEELETLNRYDISRKYVIRKEIRASNNQPKKPKESRVVEGQFHFHVDTAQLGKNVDKIAPSDIVSVTWKTHGTSGVCSHILVKRKLNILQKMLRFLGIQDSEYDYIFSSRKVIKNDDKAYNHFYDHDIWTTVGESLRGKLHKGETTYFEICGFLPTGSPIQKGYDYGCAEGKYKVYVYRVTQTNVDGVVTELPWHQVKMRAVEIGLQYVPEIYYGTAKYLVGNPDSQNWHNNLIEELGRKYVHDQDSKFCLNKVPEEGIVLRVERGYGMDVYKYKANAFYEYETKQLDSNESDLETEES